MATTNPERVSKTMELLQQGLRPFVERELNAQYGEDTAGRVKEILRDTRLGAGKGYRL